MVERWPIAVGRPRAAAGEDGKCLSGQYHDRENRLGENFRRWLTGRNGRHGRVLLTRERRRVCVLVHANAVAGVCGAGYEVAMSPGQGSGGPWGTKEDQRRRCSCARGRPIDLPSLLSDMRRTLRDILFRASQEFGCALLPGRIPGVRNVHLLIPSNTSSLNIF